jgi:hypothetical protein
MKHNLLNELSLDDITEFLLHGDLKNAPEGVAEYLNLLEKVRGMLLRFDLYPNDDIVIKHLVFHDGITPSKARTVISETREYFYVDTNVSKEAWKNIIAEGMQKLITAAILSAKETKDYVSIGKLYKDLADIRGVNDKDDNEIPYELLNQEQWIIYTFDVEDFGMTKANRNNVKALIESSTLELSDKEKQQLFREADILPFKIFPNESENARK